ncbi:phosphatidate phosphatase LPIN1 [Pteropus vampyrus]|uniref:Phosphatidate phosphatase LPIN1 n=1 Tax=Pteropus vampyrus TaxID=132908 RepID=A0A6P6CPR7_PTEVA|nr:phosphatidate phosphatase LPIN1 [Pteropus vampyrus]
MNYVGQLAGQVFVTVKELYKGLNPATLSGCIDIIVVRQPNGSLQCSPFHVRFGKMGVLRSREKVVDIEINGESVDLHMKLGDNGEAFFVQETDNDQEVIPMHLATSPILSEGASRMECQLKRSSVDRMRSLDPSTSAQVLPPTETPSSGSLVKKRRKRRRKSQLDSLKRDDDMNTSEDEDVFPIDMSSDEEVEPPDPPPGSRTLSSTFQEDILKENLPPAMTYSQSASYPNSDRDWSPNSSSLIDCNRSPRHPAAVAEGGLSSSCPPQPSRFHASESAPSREPPLHLPAEWTRGWTAAPCRLGGLVGASPRKLWTVGQILVAACASSLNFLFLLVRALTSPSVSLLSIQSPHKMKESSPLSTRKICDKMHFQAILSESSDGFSDQSPTPAGGRPVQPLLEENKSQTEMQFENDEDIEALGAAAPPLPTAEAPKPLSAGIASTAGKTDSPARKKDKRSRHLGADGVYLDDLTDMDPEVAALYFPKNGDPAGLPKHADSGARSANQSPQSVGSSGIDSGVESTSDGLRDLPSIAISLCGGLSDNREITKGTGRARGWSSSQERPRVAAGQNGQKLGLLSPDLPFLPREAVLDSCLHSEATVDSIMRDKMPRKGGRWWFSWRGRNTTIKEESKPEQCLPGQSHSTGEQPSQLSMATRIKHESSSSDDEHAAAKPSSASHLPLLSSVGYKKTLRLTSEQLKSLKLKNGPNDVVFSVTTQYQGTCRCEGTIYLWNWDDKVIISDIDGTITRSDTLGHILPTLGKDWTHQGIAKLYHKVSQNGYKFLYCSARAIGMADMTRGYLHWVNERGTVLPRGPLLLSPSSLFSALHREVIEKKPEKFKVQCLTDIKNLFFPNTEPFYAAFGNRQADVYSYKQVGVSLNRIFTVNPKGELVQEHAKTNISSYVRLCEVVDHVFPLLKRSHSSDFPCSDTFSNFTFWREPLPPFENQDVHSASA